LRTIRGDLVIEREQRLRRISLVAAIQFIAAVTPEHAGDAGFAGELGAKQRGQRGRVAERLFELTGHDIEQLARVRRVQHELGVLGLEVLGRQPVVVALVIGLDIEPDREGPHAPAQHLAGHARDGRAVGASRQEAAQVGAGGALGRLGHRLAQRPHEGGLLLAEIEGIGFFENRRPVPLNRHRAVLEDGVFTDVEPAYAFDDRQRRRNDMKENIRVQGSGIQPRLASEQRGHPQRFAGKRPLAVVRADVHRQRAVAVHRHQAGFQRAS
jgi:hypothetical protein